MQKLPAFQVQIFGLSLTVYFLALKLCNNSYYNVFGMDVIKTQKTGPCQLGQVVAFNQAENLQCMPSRCKFNANDLIPLSPYEDGLCYALGSQGPCRSQPYYWVTTSLNVELSVPTNRHRIALFRIG